MRLPAIQRITSNDASKLKVGQAHYSGLTTEQGTFVDDLLVYRLADSHFLLVVNASNIEKDFDWITSHTAGIGDVVSVNTSSRYALIAIQGPAAREVLQPLTGVDLAGMKYYWFSNGEVASVRATISRTGYTGEDGFEIFVAPAYARARLGRAPRGRPARRHPPLRPRRTRYASTRSRDAAVRQRHRRHDDRTRSRARVDRVVDEGRLSGPRCARIAEAGGRAATRSSASRWSIARSRDTAIPSSSRVAPRAS